MRLLLSLIIKGCAICKPLVIQMIFVLTTLSLYGQDLNNNNQYRLFYPQNSAIIKADYMGNDTTLTILKNIISSIENYKKINIFVYSSPEGGYNINANLARKRGVSIYNYLKKVARRKYISLNNINLDSIITITPIPENWDGLYKEIINSYNRENKEEILKILNSNKDKQEQKEAIKRLDNGESWNYILSNIMENLRYAALIKVEKKLPTELPELSIMAQPAPQVTTEREPLIDKSYKKIEPPHYTKERHTIFALKTNLLYDAVTILNAAIEFPLGNSPFSILYTQQFPWWRWGEGNNEYCIRDVSWGGEFKWWFKRKDKLLGHYLGVYAEYGKWDIEWKRDFCYQGEFTSSGLSYGYAMPIGKRLNMEFSLSAGYASIPYRHYIPADDYSVLVKDPKKHGTWNYFGITKAQISLVIPILTTKRAGGRYE